METYIVPNNNLPNIKEIRCNDIFDELLKWRNNLVSAGINCKEVEINADRELFSSFMRSILTAGISQIEIKHEEGNVRHDFVKLGLFEHNNDSVENWKDIKKVMIINVYYNGN